MLYDDLVMPGEYICHHGVKGQKWGVRKDNGRGILHEPGDATGIDRLKKSHMFKANREAYRSAASSRLKNASDKKAAIRKEHAQNFSDFVLSTARRTLGNMAGGGAVYAASVGAGIVAGLLGGPAAAYTVSYVASMLGSGALGTIATAQHVTNLVNTIDKSVTISSLAKEYKE